MLLTPEIAATFDPTVFLTERLYVRAWRNGSDYIFTVEHWAEERRVVEPFLDFHDLMERYAHEQNFEELNDWFHDTLPNLH